MAQSKVKKPLLVIAEAIEECEKVAVFGQEYSVKNSGHIGQDEEENLLAKFQMLSFYSGKLDRSVNEDEAKKWSGKLRETQVGICGVLTDIPEDVAARIPMGQRVKLMDLLAKEAGFEPDKADDGDGATPEGDPEGN